MTSETAPLASPDPAAPFDAALQQWMWRIRGVLSSMLTRIEAFLETAGFDRAPWLAVGFGSGIALWFALANRWQWMAALALLFAVAAGAAAGLREAGHWPQVRRAMIAMALT